MPVFGPGSRCSCSCSPRCSGACRSRSPWPSWRRPCPSEGGYVAWTRRAFGPVLGLPGRLVDVDRQLRGRGRLPRALRGVHALLVRRHGPLERWLLALGFIVVLTGLNLLGVGPPGRAAVLAVGALLPDGGLGRRWAWLRRGRRRGAVLPEGQTLGAGLGVGLAVVMWNYSGWDTPSTCLGETRAPERTFRGRSSWRCRSSPSRTCCRWRWRWRAGLPWSQWTTGALPRLAGRGRRLARPRGRRRARW